MYQINTSITIQRTHTLIKKLRDQWIIDQKRAETAILQPFGNDTFLRLFRRIVPFYRFWPIKTFTPGSIGLPLARL